MPRTTRSPACMKLWLSLCIGLCCPEKKNEDAHGNEKKSFIFLVIWFCQSPPVAFFIDHVVVTNGSGRYKLILFTAIITLVLITVITYRSFDQHKLGSNIPPNPAHALRSMLRNSFIKLWWWWCTEGSCTFSRRIQGLH